MIGSTAIDGAKIRADDAVARIATPSRDEFADYVRRHQPVVIEGALDDWPARRWSAEYFKATYGDRVIPAAPIRDRQVVYGADFGVRYDRVTFGEWLDRMIERTGAPSYAMFHVADVLPELADDLRVPSFCPPARWSITRFWMSPPDTGSPMHQDLPENLLAQVIGRKRLILVPPSDSRQMYRYPWTSHLPQYSRICAERPDLMRFPRFASARTTVVELGPGDLLYLPRLWWHQARSIDFSVSVNYWWATGWCYLAVSAAVAYQRLRAFRW